MTLQEMYKRIFQGDSITAEDIVLYVELAAKAINPNAYYNPQGTVTLIQSGMGGMLLGFVNESVEKHPDEVGFQVTKVYSKEGALLKVMTVKID